MIIDEDKLFPKNLAPPPMPADTRNNFTRFLSRFSHPNTNANTNTVTFNKWMIISYKVYMLSPHA